MVFDREIITQSAQETTAVGQELAASLMAIKRGETGYSRVLCLYGELGSGKTTYVQGFAKGLGIYTRLLSPTFIIVRRYNLTVQSSFFYHIDLYRISSEQELAGLGIPEIFHDSSSVTAVEWADRLGGFCPKKRMDIHFSIQEDGRHIIRMRSTG